MMHIKCQVSDAAKKLLTTTTTGDTCINHKKSTDNWRRLSMGTSKTNARYIIYLFCLASRPFLPIFKRLCVNKSRPKQFLLIFRANTITVSSGSARRQRRQSPPYHTQYYLRFHFRYLNWRSTPRLFAPSAASCSGRYPMEFSIPAQVRALLDLQSFEVACQLAGIHIYI